jgi:serine/threonine protein kinase
MNINQNKLLVPIGCGTFGEVWKADVLVSGVPRRKVAVKVSRNQLEEKEARKQIYSIRFMAVLSHPKLIRVGSFQFLDDRLCITMELADCSLFDQIAYLQNENQYVRDLLRYIRETSEVLDYLHSQQIIHGGVNPGDILLLNGSVKLADPGPSIAEIQAGDSIGLSKALCMAPERKRGEKNIHSDQFALAATYAWLRLGYPVFHPDSDRPDLDLLPMAERTVLMKALSSEPHQRFGNCVRFYEDLHSAVAL